jgi:hypothetical protein
MSDHQLKQHELLQQHLVELSLTQIATDYREALDEGARRNSSMLEVFSSLVSSEIAARRQRSSAKKNPSGQASKTENPCRISV